MQRRYGKRVLGDTSGFERTPGRTKFVNGARSSGLMLKKVTCSRLASPNHAEYQDFRLVLRSVDDEGAES